MQERTSLGVQRLGIHLPVQGTWVPSLVQDEATRFWAAKPMDHKHWAGALEPKSYNSWAHVPGVRAQK